MIPGLVGWSGPPRVTQWNPPNEVSGLITMKFDMQGRLLFLRAVPTQVEAGGPNLEPDWNLLFAEAGLDKNRFAPAGPKWLPPESFDQRADWEGQAAEQPDLTLHVTAAACHGAPVYFQVITPWDQPWRTSAATQSGISAKISTAVWASVYAGYLAVGVFFARRNMRRGRGDTRGALRLAAFTSLVYCAWGVMYFRSVPRSDYVLLQLLLLGIPLLFGMLTWIGYMAVEPYARRSWPTLMISWQRILNGSFRDPLVGRDVLYGGLAGSVTGAIVLGVAALTDPNMVSASFGRGLRASIGLTFSVLSGSCVTGLLYLGILTIVTGILRRRWLGIVATGLVMVGAYGASMRALDLSMAVLTVLVFLAVLSRVGLIAGVSYSIFIWHLVASPPLDVNQWYAGLAAVPLVVLLALLVLGFYVSLAGQPIFGSALKEE